MQKNIIDIEEAKLKLEQQQQVIIGNYNAIVSAQKDYERELQRIRNEEKRLKRIVEILDEARVKLDKGHGFGGKWEELRASLVKENIHL